MRFVICHACWSWVAPSGVTCPECQHPIDVTRPDPSVSEFATIFGEFVARIATVRMDRRKLPAWGSLVGTTTGVMFVPFLQPRVDGSLTASHHDSGRWDVWSVWRFWRRPAFPSGRMLAEKSHASLQTVDGVDLVETYLNAPGSLFVPRDQLLRWHTRGQRWSLARTRGGTLHFRIQSPPDEWRPAWRQLLSASSAWQGIISC